MTRFERATNWIIGRLYIAHANHMRRTAYRRNAPWGVS